MGMNPINASQLFGLKGMIVREDANGNIGFFYGNVELFAVSITGKITIYNGIAGAGLGVSNLVGSTLQKAETAADANVLTYTPPATAGAYRVNIGIDCSIWAANMGVTLSYKDTGGNAISQPLLIQDLTAGTQVTAIAATGNYGVTYPFNINNSATNIVIAVTGAAGNTYKITAILEQIG